MSRTKRYRKCLSCRTIINKSSRVNPYVCRNCERTLKNMDIRVPTFYGGAFA